MKPTQYLSCILVGVDTEGLSGQAVIQGLSLASNLGLELKLVLAVPVPHTFWPGIERDLLDSMLQDALESAKARAIMNLEPQLREAGIQVDLLKELETVSGNPGQVILQRAEEAKADLILLGHHAKRSLFDFGSTARGVFSRAKVPVWTQGSACKAIKSILLPVDFSEHGELAASHALSLAQLFQASVRVMHCFLEPEFPAADAHSGLPGPTYVIEHARKAEAERLDKWVAEFPWGDVPVDSSFVEGDPVNAIVKESAGHDLVVMGTHGRTGLARFVLGGVAYGVLKQAETPVLAVPSSSKAWMLE